MNTLTSDEWDDLSQHLATAKKALDAACEILAPNYLETPMARMMDDAIGLAAYNCANAVWYATDEQKRLKKEAAEVTE